MAKGKPAKPIRARSSAPAKGKAPTPKVAETAKSERKSADGAPAALTGIAIGHAAGDVWAFLSGGEPRTIAEIKKSVKAPADVVMAALGWLAREDKLEFVTSGKTVKIGLR